ncbi:MAG: hypothetical protein LBV75_07785, partial [Paludibacter sp.]|nr:hypothetical protein [Paludibacter sp.]
MKKLLILMLAVICAGEISAQTPPRWFDEQSRENNFPSSVFYTGFATGNIRSGENKEKASERLRKEAQAYCLEAIRVNVSSTVSDYSKSIKQMATNTEASEKIEAIFESSVKTEATAEIIGLKVETHAAADGMLYAFAFANKYELIGYYTASLSMNMQQLESIVSTATQFENNSEKPKAKKQYEEAIPLLVKVEQSQNMLIAIDPNASIQRDKSAKYRSEIIQALARLEQGVYLFLQCKEIVDGQEIVYIADKLPGLLTSNDCGCNFT